MRVEISLYHLHLSTLSLRSAFMPACLYFIPLVPDCNQYHFPVTPLFYSFHPTLSPSHTHHHQLQAMILPVTSEWIRCFFFSLIMIILLISGCDGKPYASKRLSYGEVRKKEEKENCCLQLFSTYHHQKMTEISK